MPGSQKSVTTIRDSFCGIFSWYRNNCVWSICVRRIFGAWTDTFLLFISPASTLQTTTFRTPQAMLVCDRKRAEYVSTKDNCQNMCIVIANTDSTQAIQASFILNSRCATHMLSTLHVELGWKKKIIAKPISGTRSKFRKLDLNHIEKATHNGFSL